MNGGAAGRRLGRGKLENAQTEHVAIPQHHHVLFAVVHVNNFVQKRLSCRGLVLALLLHLVLAAAVVQPDGIVRSRPKPVLRTARRVNAGFTKVAATLTSQRQSGP